MKDGRDKRIISTLMTLTIIFTLMGGTLSYLRWQTSEEQKTLVTFTIESEFSCAADGGGDIASSSLMPAACTNKTYAIQRTVTVIPNIKIDGINLSMDLWLDINQLGSGLSQSEYFKYALTTEENSCTTGIVSEGRFTGLSSENKDKVMLLNEQVYTSSEPQTYYLYIWIDPLEENNYIVDQSFNFSLGGSCTGEPILYTEPILNGADPELETGMIPVTLTNAGAVTVANVYDEWYSYEDKEWANAVLVNSSSRSTYINQDGTFNANTPIPEDDILAYYVWIPRYKYAFETEDSTTTSIVFENAKTTKSTGTARGTSYYTHPAFTFGNKELNGIWAGKFMTGHSNLSSSKTANNLGCIDENCVNADGLIIKPNVTTLRYNNVSNFFYASRSMSRNNNAFGLNNNNVDTHMMKNSEKGAILYLAYSVYGKNSEIPYYNNNITGRGDFNYGTTILTEGLDKEYTLPEGSEYGQSTTCNITGVFDVYSTEEYIMGNYNKTIGDSGFTELPDSKYFDIYTISSFDDCTLSECGGHALDKFRTDTNDVIFPSDSSPWFQTSNIITDDGRWLNIPCVSGWWTATGWLGPGKYCNSFVYALYLTSSTGASQSGVSFRTVLVKGI